MKVSAEASAPSNIALIKYMGKTASASNLPANASFSLTLEHLRSFVTLEESDGPDDEWLPLPDLPKLALSDFGKRKFLNHFQRLKEVWYIPGYYKVRSANNFPSDCGMASSASSFAALTLATWELAQKTSSPRKVDRSTLSRLSRLGSGSSCRSLYGPWALWRTEGAEPVELDLKLEHAVVIVGDDKKLVSSTEAHSRVNTSELFRLRPDRAEVRLEQLLAAFRTNEWRAAFELCWAEFWDMHVLFETSRPSFGYMTANSMAVLEAMRKVWRENDDGPLVTMDAGANVHILLRPDQTKAADRWLGSWKTLKSWT